MLTQLLYYKLYAIVKSISIFYTFQIQWQHDQVIPIQIFYCLINSAIKIYKSIWSEKNKNENITDPLYSDLQFIVHIIHSDISIVSTSTISDIV